MSFRGRSFHGRRNPLAVRWYLQFPISYRDLERMLADRAVSVESHDGGPLDAALRAGDREAGNAPSSDDKWFVAVDETHIKVKGRWTHFYRAVDSCGQTIDFLLSARRDAAAARTFLSEGFDATACCEAENNNRRQEPGL